MRHNKQDLSDLKVRCGIPQVRIPEVPPPGGVQGKHCGRMGTSAPTECDEPCSVGAAVLSGPPSAYAPTVSPSNSLPCQREVARAQPVTEGFRPQESYLGNGIPQSASLPASPIPFVPSGHFPLTRGIGLSQGGHSGKDSAMFTKNSCRRHDSAAIIRYSIRVPRKNEDFSPITLSPLQTHTGKRP